MPLVEAGGWQAFWQIKMPIRLSLLLYLHSGGSLSCLLARSVVGSIKLTTFSTINFILVLDKCVPRFNLISRRLLGAPFLSGVECSFLFVLLRRVHGLSVCIIVLISVTSTLLSFSHSGFNCASSCESK